MVGDLRFYAIFLAVLLFPACSFGQDDFLFGSRKFGFGSGDFYDSKSGVVVVKKGDTLYSISRSANVPIRDVVEANNLAPPYALRIGQSIVVPQNRFHIVSKGDTLYNISKKYDVDITSLSKVNKLGKPYAISIGDKLVLPASLGSDDYVETKQTTYKKQPTQNNKKVAVSNKNYKTPQRKAPIAVRSASAKYVWPVKGPIISSFGSMGNGKKNDGINIKASEGEKVVAADKGTVVYAGNELKGFGNLVLIKHADTSITAYAHNYKIHVRKGQSVYKGQQISSVGMTGGVNFPQLHFEVHINKKPVNPKIYLP